MQVGAYWIIVWALATAPMALVSALRETSVLFAALISSLILKEGWSAWRFVSAALVSFGLVLRRMHREVYAAVHLVLSGYSSALSGVVSWH